MIDNSNHRTPPARRLTRGRRVRCLLLAALALAPLACKTKEPYPIESRLRLASEQSQVWAVAPAVNLSGERGIDPLLQADLLYGQVQNVRGVRAIPVNRVAEAYASLGVTSVQTPEQAQLVCELIGADALLVPTITIYDPYDPPKIGGALQLFPRGGSLLAPAGALDMDAVRRLARSARLSEPLAMPALPRAFAQEAGMFDASHGSVRAALDVYAKGRNDPDAPAVGREKFLLSMDAYGGFVYHELLYDLLRGLPRDDAVATR